MKKLIASLLTFFILAISACMPTISTFPTPEYKDLQCVNDYELTFSDQESNDEWIVFTCSPPPPDYQSSSPTVTSVDYRDKYTVIGKADLSKSWTVAYKDFKWSNERFQYLAIYRWSQDGNYLFFTPSGSSSGGVFYYPPGFIDGDVLYRLDLNSGTLETILPFEEQGYAFSLSPNTQYLAYVTPKEKEIIHVLSLETGADKQKEPIENCVEVGGFAWKPDNINLVFTCGISGWDSGTAGTSLFLLNTNDMGVQTILYNDKRSLIPLPFWTKDRNLNYWADENLLTVWSLNDAEPSQLFVLDINTGVATLASITGTWHVATATPKP